MQLILAAVLLVDIARVSGVQRNDDLSLWVLIILQIITIIPAQYFSLVTRCFLPFGVQVTMFWC